MVILCGENRSSLEVRRSRSNRSLSRIDLAGAEPDGIGGIRSSLEVRRSRNNRSLGRIDLAGAEPDGIGL